MLLIRANSTATAAVVIPSPFCSAGRVATTHRLDEILRNDMQFFALLQKMFESAVDKRVQFVLRL